MDYRSDNWRNLITNIQVTKASSMDRIRTGQFRIPHAEFRIRIIPH